MEIRELQISRQKIWSIKKNFKKSENGKKKKKLEQDLQYRTFFTTKLSGPLKYALL